MHLMKKNIIRKTTYTIILDASEVEVIHAALDYAIHRAETGVRYQSLSQFFDDMLKDIP